MFQSSTVRQLNLIVWSVFILILSGCGSGSTPVVLQSKETITPNATIQIGTTQPEYREVTFDIHRQNNCGGNSESEYKYEQTRSIAHTVEVGGEFQVSAKGKVNIAGTGVDLALRWLLSWGNPMVRSKACPGRLH